MTAIVSRVTRIVVVNNLTGHDTYGKYLRRASVEYDIPLEVLQNILVIENEKLYMKRRHDIKASVRQVIVDAVRE